MQFKYLLKETFWSIGLYGIIRKWYREKNPKIVATELQEIKFYQNLLSEGDLVFDVGAHLGDKIHSFLACGVKTIAIEPDSRFIKHIEKRFNSQKDNLILINQGVSSQVDTLKFYRRKYASKSGFKKDWDPNITDVFELKTTTLDLIIEEYGTPQYIKIDIEGWEIEALKGLSYPIPLVSFECIQDQEGVDRALQCIDLLTSNQERVFNLTLVDEAHFFFPNWQSKVEIQKFISQGWNANKLGSRADIYTAIMSQ